MLKNADNLTIRKGEPEYYFSLVKRHFKGNQQLIYLLAYGDSIPNLVYVAELIEASGLA